MVGRSEADDEVGSWQLVYSSGILGLLSSRSSCAPQTFTYTGLPLKLSRLVQDDHLPHRYVASDSMSSVEHVGLLLTFAADTVLFKLKPDTPQEKVEELKAAGSAMVGQVPGEYDLC